MEAKPKRIQIHNKNWVGIYLDTVEQVNTVTGWEINKLQ